jgi:hypothetical protein
VDGPEYGFSVYGFGEVKIAFIKSHSKFQKKSQKFHIHNQTKYIHTVSYCNQFYALWKKSIKKVSFISSLVTYVKAGLKIMASFVLNLRAISCGSFPFLLS